ncbi:MAG: hypothetical protein ACO1RT_20445 [Planctomycetaceae bacterium]
MEPSDAQLSAFLEEALPAEQLAEIEKRLREDASLRQRLAAVIGREDAGLHSVGVIWRRRRLSCPDRSELSQYLLGVLEEEPAAYVRFHIDQVGCRYCAANLEDLRQAQAAASNEAAEPKRRRHRYFETSAGHLRRDK